MLSLDCAHVRRELSAFHDEALSVGERIAIANHLQDCAACRVEAEDLRIIREGLREGAASLHAVWEPDLGGAQSEVLERIDAEHRDSFASRAGRLTEDPRRAWTTGAAVVAGCAVSLAMVLVMGSTFHPSSLAAILDARSRAVKLPLGGPVVLPRANPDAVMPAAVMSQGDSQDGVSAFRAIVTREGYLTDVELLSNDVPPLKSPRRDTQRTSDLLAAAATARFEPARVAGSPVAVDVVWLITHKTVRGSLPHVKALAPLAPPDKLLTPEGL